MPALKHHRVVKGLTETGAVWLTDTWKFKHHALKTPTVTPVNRIIKATQHLATTIQGANTAPPNELAAIDHLRALIAGNSIPAPLPVATVSTKAIPETLQTTAPLNTEAPPSLRVTQPQLPTLSLIHI